MALSTTDIAELRLDLYQLCLPGSVAATLTFDQMVHSALGKQGEVDWRALTEKEAERILDWAANWGRRQEAPPKRRARWAL